MSLYQHRFRIGNWLAEKNKTILLIYAWQATYVIHNVSFLDFWITDYDSMIDRSQVPINRFSFQWPIPNTSRHHFNIEKTSKFRHRFNIVFSTKKWHTNLSFHTWPLPFQRTCIYNRCNTFSYRKMLMQSKFSWLNLITTHFKICAHHETSTFMLLPVVDNITFNIYWIILHFVIFSTENDVKVISKRRRNDIGKKDIETTSEKWC